MHKFSITIEFEVTDEQKVKELTSLSATTEILKHLTMPLVKQEFKNVTGKIEYKLWEGTMELKVGKPSDEGATSATR